MATKKELETQLEESKSLHNKQYYEKLALQKEIDKLKSEISSLEQNKNQILEQGNLKADFIKQILMILSGEAEVNSKYQVIRDMFSEQLKEHEERQHTQIYQQMQRNYPSDRISESNGLW